MTGAEDWSVNDATASIVADPDVLAGTDTETTIGSFTNDDFLFPTSSGTIILEGPTDFARRVRCDSTPTAAFGLLSMQFEAVNGNVMVGTFPVYGTLADGDVRARRKYVTRVVDYSNRTAAITAPVPGD